MENILNSKEEALRFINEHGLVTLFPVKGINFPNLYQATKGNREEKFNRSWQWADGLAQEKQIHYGKLVGKQVTLVSLDMLPYLYKLNKARPLNATAQRILAFLKQHGQTSTTDLKKRLNLWGKEKKYKFAEAIDQLQMAFAIAIVNREESPKMTYVYDLIERWFPERLLKKAGAVNQNEAKKKIATKLMEKSLISKPEEAEKLLYPPP